uniref:Photosystem I reaction center subunit IX n=1 Tax=Sarcinofilum mucosum TaxID=141643 RepID=A0A1W6EG80_SARMC|nr:subunit IX of photosystem I [Sarcinofilum mucosum]ARK14399.1 subunit IX of photosystem I [Sarcinofilum mucosum]
MQLTKQGLYINFLKFLVKKTKTKQIKFEFKLTGFLLNPNFLMKDFVTYLSTAPVIALAWMTFTAGLLIEINRFFPDPLVFTF